MEVSYTIEISVGFDLDPDPVPERFFHDSPRPEPRPETIRKPRTPTRKVSGLSGFYIPKKCHFWENFKRKILKIYTQFTLPLLFLKEK